jgi:hypothetical protein
MGFSDSAFKHDITEEQIEFVYASMLTEYFDNGISERGNERVMLVGFDMNGNLLEIAVELIPNEFSQDEDDDEPNFYHAMIATPSWQKKYEERHA